MFADELDRLDNLRQSGDRRPFDWSMIPVDVLEDEGWSGVPPGQPPRRVWDREADAQENRY